MKNLARFLALSLPLVGFTFPTSSLLYAQTVTPASTSFNAGSNNVCPSGKTTPAPCDSEHTLSFSVTAGTTVGGVAILTTGAPDLDFKAKANDTSTTLCKAQTYASAATCTVDVTFAPLAPGARNGAVEILDGSGSVLAMTYIHGIGVGPQVAFTPWVEVFRGSGFNLPEGLAVDANGNIFVADGMNGAVKEVLAADDYATIKTINLVSSSSYPIGVAVDGAGNLFVSDHSYATVDEILAVGGYTTIRSIGSGFRDPFGLAVDGEGNVFVADGLNSTVNEILAAGGYTTVKTLGGGFTNPSDVAVDAAGNVFVADYANAAVKEILAAGGYTTVKTLGSGFQMPVGVAVDAAGNVFVADLNYHGVEEILAADDYSTVENLGGYPYPTSLSVAVDAVGNIFLLPFTSPVDAVTVFPRSQTPALAFSPPTGTTYQMSATLQNVGNATLTASGLVLTDTVDFALVAGSGTPPDCAATFSLAASEECNLSVDFTPQSAGPLTGSLVLTDNSGNAAAATQSISLSGTGAAAMANVSPAVLQFGSVPYPGGSATLPLTVTNTGTGKLTIDPSSNGRGAVITGSTCGAGLSAGKSCTLQVEFKPVQLGLNTNTLTIQTNGVGGPQVPVRGIASGVGSVSTTLAFGTVKGRGNSIALPLTVTNFGVLGNVTVATETGATTFKILSNGCTAGITAANSCTIEVEYAPVQQGTQTGYLKLIPSTGPEQIIVMVGALAP
jgi:sugar lactone lactonase YvrE